jgi:hypothetical protein
MRWDDFNFKYELNEFETALCESQGNLFRECQFDFKRDAHDFVTKFMNSSVAAGIDDKSSSWRRAGNKQKGEELLRTTQVIQVSGDYTSPDALYWVGYMYRYWACLGASSKEIIAFVPVDLALGTYAGYHCLALKEAIRMYMKNV